MIKLGLTPSFFQPDPSRVVFGHKSLTYVENDMITWTTRKGVMTILIPDVSDDLIDMYVNEIDGLVVTGGTDVSPESYGDPAIENGRWPGDRLRDKVELKIIDRAFKKNIPILGICRGMQLLNVYFGGKLYQDIKTETGSEVIHRDADKYDSIYHEVTLGEGSLLKEIYSGQNKLVVNSVHHQCVKVLAPDLIEDARCPEDDIIEAWHHKDMDRNTVLAVQWHPEFSHTLGSKVAPPEPLFNYFLEQVEKNK